MNSPSGRTTRAGNTVRDEPESHTSERMKGGIASWSPVTRMGTSQSALGPKPWVGCPSPPRGPSPCGAPQAKGIPRKRSPPLSPINRSPVSGRQPIAARRFEGQGNEAIGAAKADLARKARAFASVAEYLRELMPRLGFKERRGP